MTTYVVYWLYDDVCTDPYLHGYIGISKDLNRRLYEHRQKKRHPEGFLHKVLHEFDDHKKALEVERIYRPYKGIAWNLARGGEGPHLSWKLSDEMVQNRIEHYNKKYDIRGQIFGQWKVIEQAEPGKRYTGTSRRIRRWLCECIDCGEISEPIQAAHLKSGHTSKHCASPTFTRPDLTDSIFGDLKVLYRIDQGKWRCECQLCHGFSDVKTHKLISGHTQGHVCSYSFNGLTMTITEWAEHLEVVPSTIYQRLKKWPIEKALGMPRDDTRRKKVKPASSARR